MAEYERLKALIEEEREKSRQATATWAEHINTISRLRREAQMREQESCALRAILAALREPSEAVVEAALDQWWSGSVNGHWREQPGAVRMQSKKVMRAAIGAAIEAAIEAAEREAAAKDPQR